MSLSPPGVPASWPGGLQELERLEWSAGDGGDPGALLQDLLDAHGLGGPLPARATGGAVVLLLGAAACAVLAGLPAGPPSPVPAVPDLVAVAVRPGAAAGRPAAPAADGGAGPFTCSWTDDEHAAAVEQVRAVIARGGVYQANVVGHRRAEHRSDPAALAGRLPGLAGATYGGLLGGDGWAVGCASPEQLVRVEGRRVTTVPVKGTLPVTDGAEQRLRASGKDRAEHVMIVDLERNDLARVARTGSVEVEQLYALTQWSGLWHAGSRVAAELADGVTALDVVRALAPGGSVTGAPKRAAWSLLGDLEPVGRGPSMGALGVLHAGGLDLGLTIRTAAVDEGSVHLWAGGGITWGSDAEQEVAEAHAKAAPVVAALRSGPRPPAPRTASAGPSSTSP
jgi:para-aminobenzoate synthetase component 1